MTGSSHCTTRKGTVAAVALVALAGTALGAAPASASGSTVTAGKNITVLASIDMVAVSGYGAAPITVDVLDAAGKIVGTETAEPYDVEGTRGLEINHGPDGDVRDGDCWDQLPDIRPGHTVRVTYGVPKKFQQVIVDDVHFEEREPVGNEVVVRGIALKANGDVIPLGSLDANEFRNVDGKFRASPIDVTRWAGHRGGFELHYSKSGFDRNRRGLTQTQRVRALLTENGHAAGYGHVDNARESQFVEGFRPSTAAVTADGC